MSIEDGSLVSVHVPTRTRGNFTAELVFVEDLYASGYVHNTYVRWSLGRSDEAVPIQRSGSGVSVRL